MSVDGREDGWFRPDDAAAEVDALQACREAVWASACPSKRRLARYRLAWIGR